MEAAAEDGSRVGDGVAETKGGDGVKDECLRVGSVLAGFSDETMQAFGAFEYLKCSKAVAALAFLHSVFAATMCADRVRLFVLYGRHSYGSYGWDS